MKQQLNDRDLDRQLKRKMAEAESMAPAFNKLFPSQLPKFRFFTFGNISILTFLIASVAISVSNQNGFSVDLLISNSRNFAEIQNERITPSNGFEHLSSAKGLAKLEILLEKKTPETTIKKSNLLVNKELGKSITKQLFRKSEKLAKSKPMLLKGPASALSGRKEDVRLLALSRIYANKELIPSSFEEVAVSGVEFVFKKTKQKQKIRLNGKSNWFVGLTSAVDNTWIINQNTYNEFDGYEFAYKIDWGYQYGFRVGYNPVKGLGFELGYIPKSTKGQRYEDVIHFENTRREVDLEYSKVPFKLKWRHPLSKSNRVSLNWELGGAFSILHNAHQNNNGKVSEITERFRKNTWQANTGLMADFNLNERVFISAGLQGSISQDINAPKWQASDNYGKSHTLTLGLQLGISRRL
ncbi:MAG: hypothetical protein ACI85I_001938 [Arenicella sp.]|jgi:hypothetical protein